MFFFSQALATFFFLSLWPGRMAVSNGFLSTVAGLSSLRKYQMNVDCSVLRGIQQLVGQLKGDPVFAKEGRRHFWTFY